MYPALPPAAVSPVSVVVFVAMCCVTVTNCGGSAQEEERAGGAGVREGQTPAGEPGGEREGPHRSSQVESGEGA